LRFLALLLLTAGAASAGEYALLANGARMHVERHEIEGNPRKDFLMERVTSKCRRPLSLDRDRRAAPGSRPHLLPTRARGSENTSAHTIADRMADAAADKYFLPRSLVRSVMAAESGFQADAVSPKGAIGLMQLMPQTRRIWGRPHDPAQTWMPAYATCAIS